ncbi:MAG: HipA N-terminal domain-containing protein [Paludibacteraceae bacterium]|nr:HipA N-terminal domain-containing protein [Paludibacteraceae bacterium]
MKKAKIYYKDLFAGTLVEDEHGFAFTYDSWYLQQPQARPISLTLPLREESYKSDMLFPFFDGLIPEGWLLNIAQEHWKIDPRDRMALLLACCKDCIGAVSVIEEHNSITY